MSDGRLVHASCKAHVTRVPRRRQTPVAGGTNAGTAGSGQPVQTKATQPNEG
jgi:hypothetical protein